MEDTELMTVEDAARACRVGRSTMYGWVSQGVVPVFRFGGVLRIPRAALLAMIDAQVEGAASPGSSGPAVPRSGKGS
jgi:excisionase family DNA binding protein